MFTKKFVNKIIQVIYFIVFRMRCCYWFICRPQCYSAYVGVWYKDTILIIKNSYKRDYTVPCGGVKKKEIAVMAAVRELAEEVNIRLKPDQLSLAGRFIVNHEHIHDNVSFYEIRFDRKPQFQIDNREVTWAKFLTVDQACQLLLSPVVSIYLSKWCHDQYSEPPPG